jgi:hypothetical protein
MPFEEIDQKSIAVQASVDALAKLSRDFLGALSMSLNLTPPKGTRLTIKPDGVIEGNLFGVAIDTTPRPVVMNNKFGAIEYEWLAEQGGASYFLTRMYLQPGNENITTDAAGKDSICQWGNTYVAKILLGKLTEALLTSSVFEPNDPES